MKSDIQIAQETEMSPITEVAAGAGIDEKYLEHYGKYKAKIDFSFLADRKDKENGKLILVTAITPTRATLPTRLRAMRIAPRVSWTGTTAAPSPPPWPEAGQAKPARPRVLPTTM